MAQSGRPGRSRTCNPRIRNPMLYPLELRALNKTGFQLPIIGEARGVYIEESGPARRFRLTAGLWLLIGAASREVCLCMEV